LALMLNLTWRAYLLGILLLILVILIILLHLGLCSAVMMFVGVLLIELLMIMVRFPLTAFMIFVRK